MSFFDDVLAPFSGIDIGWDGDPDAPVGEYTVEPDDAEAADHDFKISVVESGGSYDITVAEGYTHNIELHDDAGTPPKAKLGMWPQLESEVTFAGKADNTTWGIWMKCTAGSPSGAYDTEFGDVGLLQADHISSVSIIADATHTDPIDLNALTKSTTGFSYVLIGKVVIASGVVTITQLIKEAIVIPVPVYIADILSTDANNDLIKKAGGSGLYVRLKSGNTPNHLHRPTVGEGLLMEIEAGDGISEEETDGVVTITNDGVLSLTDNNSSLTFSVGGAGITGHIQIDD